MRSPQRFGLTGLLAALAVCLVWASAVTPVSAAADRSDLDVLATEVVGEINAVRRAHGLAPLQVSRSLSEAARAHSLAMARTGFFGHTSADGTPFWRRISRFYGASRFGRWAVGENLLWASPTVDPGQAARMWLASPSHRQTMLTAWWREIGLAVVRTDAAPGFFANLPVTVITADFGVRR